MRIHIDLSGLWEIRDYLEGVRNRLKDPTPMTNRCAIVIRRGFGQHFDSQGATAGGWVPLAPSTMAGKQRLFEMGPAAGGIQGRVNGRRARIPQGATNAGATPGILVRTGLLKDSLTRRGKRGNIHRVSSDGKTLEVGTNIPYADVHDKGGKGEYTITAKPRPDGKPGLLAWYGIRKDGTPGKCFARSIKHPPMPRRRFLFISESTWMELMGTAEQYIWGEQLGPEQEY